MNNYDIDYHIARLTSGTHTFQVDGRWYITKPPSALAVMMSREVRREAEQKAQSLNLMDESAAIEQLIERELWSEHDQQDLDDWRNSIKDRLAVLYEQRDNKDSTMQNRNLVNVARKSISYLENLRSQFYDMTSDYYIQQAQTRFICGSSLYYEDGVTPYWKYPLDDRFRSDSIVDLATQQINADKLSITSLRSLSRSPQWLTLWYVKENTNGLIDQPACRVTDELTILIQWTMHYQNARSYPPEDRPTEETVNDDDMFDGWQIFTDRKLKAEAERNHQLNRYQGKAKRPPNEIFVMATSEDYKDVAKKVQAGMSDVEKLRRKNRMAYLKSDEARELAKYSKTGSIPEYIFPEVTNKFGLDRDLIKIKIKDKANGQEQD